MARAETVPTADLTAVWIATNCPEIATALRAEGRNVLVAELEPVAVRNQSALAALIDQARSEGATTAATAERTRILGIQAHVAEGAEDVIAACVADASVTPDAAAGRVLAHLRTLGGDALSRLRKTEPAQPPAPGAGDDASDEANVALIKGACDQAARAHGLSR